MDFSWLLSNSEMLQMFLSIYRQIYLVCRCIFFECKLGTFTSLSSFVLEDNYDYMFYRETLLDSGESTYESVTSKNSL